MKVTPSPARRDNEGFNFTTQAYQMAAEHAHTIMFRVCVCVHVHVGLCARESGMNQIH